MTPLIRRFIDTLEAQLQSQWHPYTVPGAWVQSQEPVVFPSAASYLLHQLQHIEKLRKMRKGARWSLDGAYVYNAMVRHATSYQHGSGTEQDGWRSTGTFAKMVGLLPYLVHMGIDTIMLLPITDIGEVGKKGSLGSPYSVKNPFRLSPNLGEPALQMSLDDQFRVFVELCHLLNIKVILEVVLRTASIDSDLVQQQPQWFYWVDEAMVQELGGFSAPHFSKEQIKEAYTKVEQRHFVDLPEPSEEYRNLFTSIPMRVERDEQGWKGIGPKARALRIPGAFADWPPDDPQPAWTDVTYLKLHDHPRYRYMAYNTVRMIERTLDITQYRQSKLWNMIAGMIPHFVRSYNIDGAMIDMGHALPRDLRRRVVQEAKQTRSDLVLFEENFTLTAASAADGYDAVIGYLPFDAYIPEKLKEFVQRAAENDIPIRYFATPESHNTPRFSTRVSQPDAWKALQAFLRLLPKSIAFMHAGIEMGETIPVNTGLGFSSKELKKFREEKLPLFDDVPLPWDNHTVPTNPTEPVSIVRGTHSVLPISCDQHNGLVAYMAVSSDDRRATLVMLNASTKAIHTTLKGNAISRIAFLAPHDHVTMKGALVEVSIEPWTTLRCSVLLR